MFGHNMRTMPGSPIDPNESVVLPRIAVSDSAFFAGYTVRVLKLVILKKASYVADPDTDSSEKSPEPDTCT